MTRLSRIAAFLASPATADSCTSCHHFDRAPDRIEDAMPGLSALASAQASTFDGNGLCRFHDRIINGRGRCPAFVDQPSSNAALRLA
ncbi:hypothetical protein ACFSUK_05775 [Sphingobium scionense]|uniref:Uncharacterized protein n=1 Tax=Sphingobium scionense TaxID=1404341 RepID=A0A7W6PTH2_9SPHN|nr:hypothetical protein [Sphingobium scionense]MBB4147340.1 hypothetical protein [Sphingobium scionense]